MLSFHNSLTNGHESFNRNTTGLAATAPGVSALLGGMVFPVGLTMILFSGTDLLTSNMLYTTLPFLTAHNESNAKKTASLTRVISVCGQVNNCPCGDADPYCVPELHQYEPSLPA